MDFIIYFVLVIIFIIVFALYLKKVIKQHKPSETDADFHPENHTEIRTEFNTVKILAEVVDLSCYVNMIGTKNPETVEIYTVIFETDSKKIISVNVPKEMYDGIEKGQRGELTLVEGELYSFII